MIVANISATNVQQVQERSRDLDLLSNGDYQTIQRDLQRKFPTSYSKMDARAIPFVERYVAELGGRYRAPVVRRFLNAERDQWQRLTQVYEDSGIDEVMADVERHLLTQSTVIAIVLPDGPGRVHVETIVLWQVEDVQISDPLKARDPRSWDSMNAQVPASVVGHQVVMAQMELTRTKAARPVNGTATGIYAADGSHNFGVVPVVVAHSKCPDKGRWWASPNEALLNLQVSLSLQAADNESIIRNCAFPQKTIKNATVAQQVEELQIGPDKVVAMVRSGNPDDPPPELAIVQGQVPVSELVTNAEHQIRLYCSMLGLDPSTFLRVNTAVTASARLFSAQDRAKQRKKLDPVLRRFERDLARMIARVINQTSALQLPLNVDVALRYSDPEPTNNPLHDAQALRENVQTLTDNPVDVIARREGIGRAAARAIIDRNRSELEELGLYGGADEQPEQTPENDAPDEVQDGADDA